MEVHEALQQIDAIRAQVARTEIFRGYKAATIGATGVLGLIAAALQSVWISEPASQVGRYLQLWIGVAALSIAIVATELIARWLRTDSPLERGKTQRAVEQFLPCIVAGGALTAVIMAFAPDSAALLPGLWAIVFSLGVFASWRQLPPPALAVAFYYLAAGIASLAWARGPHALSPWAMAGSFGVGQLLTAVILYSTLERTRDAR
jgi:hypothetical protein